MEITLKYDDTYRVVFEKIGSENWISLHELSTGLSQTLIHKRGFGHTKAKLIKEFKNYTMVQIKCLFESLKLPKQKVYDTNLE